MKHSPTRTPAVIAGVFTLIALSIALALTYWPNHSSPKSPPAMAQGVPGVQITRPGDGEVIKGTMVTVHVRPDNFKVMAPRAQNVPGEGHLHLRLNDGSPLEALSNGYVFTQIEAARHKLEVELVNHDHSPLNPPVRAVVRFQTVTPSMLDFSRPWPWILGASILAAGFLTYALARARR